MLKKLLSAILKPFSASGLNQVIFFITSKCNLHCRNCFNWSNLNKSKDLSLEEVERLARGLPKFKVLLISGGEPFLRKDLPEVISLFWRINKINFVGIPTNGTQTKEIVLMTKKILEINQRLSVNLYFSIDGLESFHDEGRGIKGSFEKNINTIEKTRLLKKKYPNLSISINTVISSENIDEIPNLLDFIKKKGKNFVDGHYFEIIRGLPKDPRVKDINTLKLKELYLKKILPYQRQIYSQRKKGIFGLLLARLATVNLFFLYKTQFDNFTQKKAWPMKCLAGKSILVITNDGNLAVCELRPVLSNVKKINYNIKKWLEIDVKKENENIKKEQCYCTHACFITESMYRSKKVVFWLLPRLFWQNLRGFSF